MAVKNYYKMPNGVVPDPFVPLYDLESLKTELEYHGEEDEFVLVPEAEEVIAQAKLLESMIPGDFDIFEVAERFRANIYTWVINSLLAYKVKAFKLYKDKFKSFQHYCEKALGVSHWQVNRMIEGARVWMEIAASGKFAILPKNESQTRVLVKLTPEQRIETWEKLTAKEEHKITATAIKEELGIVDEDTAVRLNKGLLAKLKAKAAAEGKTLEEFLGSLVEQDIEGNPQQQVATEEVGESKKPSNNVAQTKNKNLDKNLANCQKQENHHENSSHQAQSQITRGSKPTVSSSDHKKTQSNQGTG